MGIFDGMNDIFGVGNTISQSSNTQPDDVLKTKTALAQTGHYQVPDFGITDIPDMGMIDGLKGFQQDNGLKVDGVMKPGGPTETKLGETLANQGIGNMDLLEQAKPKKPKIDPLTGVEEIKMPKLKKPKQTPWFQSPKVQPVEYEAHSANTRTMDGLLKYSVNGSLPYLYADSIKNGGDKAINEYANFMQQLNDRKSDRVETFHQEVMERLPEPHKQKFTALEMVDDRNETPLDQGDWNEHAQRVQATGYQTPEDIEAGPSLYRTASAETSFSQPIAAAMMSESDGGDKNAQGRSYEDWDQDNPERTWDPEQEKRDRKDYARKNPEEMEERRLDRIEKNLRTGSKIGRAAGLDGAADDLDQFLDKDTSDRHISREEAREDPFIERAEETNRKNFENRTFLGKTGENHELNKKLRNLKDGESIRIKDHWVDSQNGTGERIWDNFRMGPIDGVDNALRYGRQRFRTDGDLIATRRKNKIVIKGTVEHNGDDDYDFHKDGIDRPLGAYDLQKAGRGKTHKNRRRWKQKVKGTVNIKKNTHSKDGYDLVNPQFKWDDFE